MILSGVVWTGLEDWIELINCYIILTTKHLIPGWSIIGINCVIVYRNIVTAKQAKSMGCIKFTPLIT